MPVPSHMMRLGSKVGPVRGAMPTRFHREEVDARSDLERGRELATEIGGPPQARLRRSVAGLRRTYVRLRDDWGAMKAPIKAVFGWIDPHDPCRYLAPNVPGEDIEVSQDCIDQVLREFNPPFRR